MPTDTRPSPFGGVTAIVLLPASLIADPNLPPPPPPPEFRPIFEPVFEEPEPEPEPAPPVRVLEPVATSDELVNGDP